MDRLYHPSPGILLHPRQEASMLQTIVDNSKKPPKGKKKSKSASHRRTPILSTLDFGRHALLQNWKDLYTTKCPICLEESIPYSEGVILPHCQHYCCRECFTMYLRFKVDDIRQHRTNPFVCPVESCKRELPPAYCKPFLTDEHVRTAKAWYKDLKRPPAWSLDRCLRTKACGGVGSMRRRKGVASIHASNASRPPPKTDKTNNLENENIVYCEDCKAMWCELCLVRVYDDLECRPTHHWEAKHTISQHRFHCHPEHMVRFCHRYRTAADEIKSKCEAKYPWISSYSQFCIHDGAALQYVRTHAQACPSCKTGIERSEGCFHMKCPNCATHFCYECGEELFPPYYGTHHCWENNQEPAATVPDHGDYEMDEQLAMALQYVD